MQKVFCEGDIVQHDGTKRLGTIIKTCDGVETDDSTDDSDEDHIEGDNIEKRHLTVQWYTHPSESTATDSSELADKRSLSLINRRLKPGDFVQWANNTRSQDGRSIDQKGQVLKVDEFVSCRLLSTDFIVKDVEVSEVLPLQDYAPRQVVIDDQWVGIIETVSLQVMLQLPNGNKALISGDEILHLKGVTDQLEEGSTFHCPEFYQGQTVYVKSQLFDDSSGVSQKGKSDDSQIATLAIVDKVSVARISIDWKTYGYIGKRDAEKKPIRPPQPPRVFYRGNIDRLKVLSDFNPTHVYLGKKAYYKLSRKDVYSFHEMHQNVTRCEALSPDHLNLSYKGSNHDFERRYEPQPLLFNGENVCVEVCNIKTLVTVLWQDGSTKSKILSTDLQLLRNLDRQDFFPGNLVSDAVTHDVGIVQSADSVERTCMVKWREYSVLGDDGRENSLLNESVYSIKHTQDVRLEINEVVVRFPPFNSQSDSVYSLLQIGILLRIRKANFFTVFWSDGTRSYSSTLSLTDLDIVAVKSVYWNEEDEDVDCLRPISLNDDSLLEKIKAETSQISRHDEMITLKLPTKEALVYKLNAIKSDFNPQKDDTTKSVPQTGTMKKFNTDGSILVLWNDGSQSSVDPFEVSIVRQREREDTLLVPPVGITQRYNIDGSVQILWNDLSSVAVDSAELEFTNWYIHDNGIKMYKQDVDDCIWDTSNDIQKDNTLDLYERDIVQDDITKRLGMVIESSQDFDDSSTESEDESDEFMKHEKNVTVEWYNPNSKWTDKDNAEVLTADEKRIRLIDRSLLPGDFVRWAISLNGKQKGQVMEVFVKVYCRVIGTNFIMRGIDISQLSPLQPFAPLAPVTKGQWAGVVDSVAMSITLLLPNDTRVIITGDNCKGIQDITDQRKEMSRYYCSGFYRGQRVRVKARILEEAKWTSGCVRSANRRRMVSAIVDDVGVEGINISWKIQGHTGNNESDENNPLLEPQPLSYFDESTISTVKGISDFTQADIQIGEKAYYELTGADMKEYNEMKGTAETQHDGIRVKMVQGAKVCVEVCNKITHVTVAWQDGSIQHNVASTNLHPIDTFSTEEFFPGDFVIPKRRGGAIQQSSPCEMGMGVVKSVDSETGVCDVEWCHGNDCTYSSACTKMDDKINATDFKLHEDCIFRIGDIVVRLKPIDICSTSLNEKEDAEHKSAIPKPLRELPLVGQIMKVNNDASVQVRWINSSISSMQPNELHVVREGKDWKPKDDVADRCDEEVSDNWLCEALLQAEASAMPTSPLPLPNTPSTTVQQTTTAAQGSPASPIIAVHATRQPTHLAPGGRSYKSVRDAGRATLEIYCDNYPSTQQSYVLPVLFKAEYPDAITKKVSEVPSNKQGSFFGFLANQSGEQAEYAIFNALNSVIRQRPADCTLVFFNLKLGKGKNILRRVLQAELPCIDLSNVITSGEIDVLAFVKNAGVVICEVKRSASTRNMEKAEEQLDNDVAFITSLIKAISGLSGANLPIARLVIIPNESHPSSTSKTPSGSHVVDKDQIPNFPTEWNRIVKGMKTAYSCRPTDFEQLVQTVTGIWTMKPVKSNYEFDLNDASVLHNLITVDDQIKDGNISSKQGAVFTDNLPTTLGDIFKSTNEMNLLYLSPQQKLIYEHYQHVLMRAHAGCGKSLLILFKIIDIIQNAPTQKAVVIAPPPHHIRCKNILNANRISADIISSFPYRPGHLYSPSMTSACSVLILTLQDFFGVTKSMLFSYDLSLLNIFIDDLHAYRVEEGSATYEDIGYFLDDAYKTAKKNNLYAWFGVDVVQGGFRADDATRPTRLFMKKSQSVYFRRRFEIPVVVMDQVLRNTKEVVDVLKFARSNQVQQLKLTTTLEHVPTAVISDIHCGHRITSEKVYCHRLEYGTPISYTTKFLCERVKDFFLKMHVKSVLQFDFSTVAILFEDNYVRLKHEPALAQMFFNKFNKVGVQNIEQQLRNLKCTDVVIDRCENAQSFECPSVVFVRSSSFGVDDLTVSYNAISRARTKCMIVDIACDCQAFIIRNVDYIEWRTNKMGSFSRC